MFVPFFMNTTFNIVICENGNSPLLKTFPFLEEQGYKVSIVANEQDVSAMLHKQSVQLIILDLDFNDKDGISLTSEIRQQNSFEQPFILITSNKEDDYIQIAAFNSGADDFIINPINPIVLAAKIAAYKKRYLKKHLTTSEDKVSPKFLVDKDQYLIVTEKGKVSLPRKEFEMIYLMYQNTKKTFTRQDFANLIWNTPEVANSRTIDIHIRNIRRSLGSNIIKTSKGIGYSINEALIS